MYEYDAEVLRVIDGDTYELRVDVGFHIGYIIHLRLQGVNAAEVEGSTKEEGLRAKDYVKELFEKHGNRVKIKTFFKRSFARWVGEVFIGDLHLADHLLQEGYAVTDKRR